MNNEDRRNYSYISSTPRNLTNKEAKNYQSYLDNYEKEAYINAKRKNIEERKKRQERLRISEKNSKKKQIPLKIKLAAVAAMVAVSAIGFTMFDGTQKIVERIDEAGFVSEQVFSRETSEGFPLFEIQGDGIAPVQIDGNAYMEQLFQAGYNNGFTQEEMTIYAEAVYGTDYGLGSSDILGQMEAKFNASINNKDLVETEGRGAR